MNRKFLILMFFIIIMSEVKSLPLYESIGLTPIESGMRANQKLFNYGLDNQIVDIIEIGGDGTTKYESSIILQDNYTISMQLNNIDYNYTESDFLDYHERIANYNNHFEFASNALDLQQQRQVYFDHALIALNKILIKHPELAESLSQAAGYGVFQATSLNLVLYAGGWGGGVVFDNQEHRMIYVSIFRAGTGWGLGYINDLILVIFHDHSAITQYFGLGGKGADIGASASLGVYGGAMSFNPYISIYKLYNYGANIQANWGATLYWAPPELNAN